MATTRLSYRDASHPSLNETLKSHNARTLKLVKMGECMGVSVSVIAGDGN